MNEHTTLHLADYANEAARHILDLGRSVLAERGLFRLGLAGGNTPRVVYEAVARLAGDFAWAKTQITFGDERCVPPDDPESNYGMASESLLKPVNIPEGNVFRMRGEIESAAAADEYESRLASFASRMGEPRYVHDVLLLGLGPDGHTASLFPGSPALDEQTRNVLPVIGPKPPPQRITLTFPIINASRRVIFLANDPGKRSVIEAAQAGDPQYPSSRVTAATWLLGF
jgi:6-phosphogluconolactonase